MRPAVLLFIVFALIGEIASATPQILLSSDDVLMGERVQIKITGVKAESKVTLEARTLYQNLVFRSQTVFKADARGEVDISNTAPLSGAYTKADAWGPFWSMTYYHAVQPGDGRQGEVNFFLSDESGGVVAERLLRVRDQLPGVFSRDVRDHGLYGEFFFHAGQKKPVIVVLGGSEGGISTALPLAAYWASKGYSALALAYFDVPGSTLSERLQGIPLEYFQSALSWLKVQPEVDADRIAILGISRGAELALTIASRFPQVKAVVAIAPSSVNWGTFVKPEVSSWKQNGADLSFVPFALASDAYSSSPMGTIVRYRTSYLQSLQAAGANPLAAIPVERINGPVLLIAGEDDHLWPSCVFAKGIMDRLQVSKYYSFSESICYPGTGHVPYLPGTPTTANMVPLDGGPQGKIWMDLGGNAEDTAKAGLDAWENIRRFFHDRLQSRTP